jgi:hypothetical protein
MVSTLRSRFSTPELLALGGSLLVLAVFLVFGVLASVFYPGDIQVVLAAALVFMVVAQRYMLWDFGSAYDSIILVVGALSAVVLVENVLFSARENRFSGVPAGYLLGLLLMWVGQALVAGAAGVVWQRRRT